MADLDHDAISRILGSRYVRLKNKPRFGQPIDLTPDEEICDRCEGDGKAHGADRPFEWSGPGTYPGPCPKCGGTGKLNRT